MGGHHMMEQLCPVGSYTAHKTETSMELEILDTNSCTVGWPLGQTNSCIVVGGLLTQVQTHAMEKL